MTTRVEVLASGELLVVGGVDPFGNILATAEVYAGGSWTTLPLPGPRYEHAAARLTDGRVLIIGGQAGSIWEDTNIIFDPGTRSVAQTAKFSNNWARLRPSAELLLDGRVLVAGGAYPDTVEEAFAIGDADLYESIAW